MGLNCLLLSWFQENFSNGPSFKRDNRRLTYAIVNIRIYFSMQIGIENKKDQLIIASAGAGLAIGVFAILRFKRKRQTKCQTGQLTPDTLPKNAYDAVIAGAGKN